MNLRNMVILPFPGDVDIVKILIEHGANIRARDLSGINPLDLAYIIGINFFFKEFVLKRQFLKNFCCNFPYR